MAKADILEPCVRAALTICRFKEAELLTLLLEGMRRLQ